MTLDVTAARCARRIENGLSLLPNAAGRFPQVSGLAIEFDPRRPAGKRVLSIKVGGAPLDPDKTYRIATNDFLARGGDGYVDVRRQPEPLMPIDDTPLLANEVMVYLRKLGTVRTGVEGRIVRKMKAPPRQCAAAPLNDIAIDQRPAAQFEARDAGGNAQAGLTLHADRLQRDRVVRAADQRIGADADADRGAGGRADIVAGEVAAAETAGRREHRPCHRDLLVDADVEADAPHGGVIGLARAAGRRTEHAAQVR